jgi:hypothetical protein
MIEKKFQIKFLIICIKLCISPDFILPKCVLWRGSDERPPINIRLPQGQFGVTACVDWCCYKPEAITSIRGIIYGLLALRGYGYTIVLFNSLRNPANRGWEASLHPAASACIAFHIRFKYSCTLYVSFIFMTWKLIATRWPKTYTARGNVDIKTSWFQYIFLVNNHKIRFRTWLFSRERGFWEYAKKCNTN